MNNISFWKLNRASEQEGAVITVSSNQSIADNIVDNDLDTFWLSSTGNDLTTETLEFVFLEPEEISMIMLRKHNFKEFNIQYWNGTMYVDFSPIISETTNSASEILVYKSFTPVITLKIKISVTKTIAINEQKKIAEVIISDLIGQFNGYPILGATVNKKIVSIENYRGKQSVFEKGKYLSFKLGFQTYPEKPDLLLAETIRNLGEEFYIWPTNGEDADFYENVEPFRKQDFYLVNDVSDFSPDLNNGVYIIPFSFEMNFTEA